MGASQETLVEPLVWITEAGRRDTNIARQNQRKVRQQAKRYHVALQERERQELPVIFEFVNGLKNSYPSRDGGSKDASTSRPASSREIDRSSAKTGLKSLRSDSSVKQRLFRLQAMAIKLQHIAEGGYTAARIAYDFDILDLSTLTSAHMGRTAAARLHDDKSALQGYLRVREVSFLEFVPQLYAESALLRTVVDCVLSQAQRTLCQNPRVPQAEVYALYQKAIQSLQEALNHESTAFESEVLCSVQLMQLFEALHPAHLAFWSQHSCGVRRIIRMRGPQRCHTDFDRALLYSQLGTIFGEALIDRTDCFLGEPDWQAAFNDFINFETSAYKANEIKLWSLEVKIPGLMKEADEVIHAVDHASDVEQSSLHKRLRIHRKESLQLEEEAASRTDNEQDLYFKNLESLALAYGADILVNRTIISLDPRAADAAAIETETMGLADKVLATAQALQVHAQRGDLLVGRAILVARMANRTHNSVVSAIEGCGEFLDASKKHIAPNIWEDQCRLLGRKEFSGQGQR